MHAEFMDGQVASWPVPHCCRQVLHALIKLCYAVLVVDTPVPTRPVGRAKAYVFYFELGQSGAEGFQFVNDSDLTRCLAANGTCADTGWLSIRSQELSIPTVWWLNQAIAGVHGLGACLDACQKGWIVKGGGRHRVPRKGGPWVFFRLWTGLRTERGNAMQGQAHSPGPALPC